MIYQTILKSKRNIELMSIFKIDPDQFATLENNIPKSRPVNLRITEITVFEVTFGKFVIRQILTSKVAFCKNTIIIIRF